MLTKLSVKNFAIIEDIDISFKEGLTVLTGETGAGKSLIIDSISLLLGERASLEMIRNGEDKATITGTFVFRNARLNSALDKLDIPYSDNTITVSRTISESKNVVKINDKTITLNELKTVSKYLADIHQQFDMVKLLNKENYLDIIDGYRFDLVNEYKEKYLLFLDALRQKEAEYVALSNKIDHIKKERETYEFELQELEAYNLVVGEEEDLTSRADFLKNYDKIYDLLAEIKSTIDKDSLDDIYQIKENLEKLQDYQSEYKPLYESLNNYYYELESIYDDLKYKFNHINYDPKELDEIETRRNDIALLKKKYGKSIVELIEYQKELKILLQSDEDLDISLEEKRKELSEAYDKTYKAAKELSEVRKGISKAIEKELMANLKDLALSSLFQIAFATSEKSPSLSLDIFKENGIDEIDFLIETNVGEGLKPLAKVVSGGEMSRIMLAIKALFIKSQKISTIIFDEVDTGISGEIARKVALKIFDISLSTQVISITHLPQVASLSNSHIKISKKVVKGRTYTTIKELSLEEKIYEIASMISGGKVTQSQLDYAKEMILNKE